MEHFAQKTKRTSSYEYSVVTNVTESTCSRRAAEALRERRVHGFNAIFATASIDAARRYYNEFQRQQEELAPDKRLKIAIIYSYGANEATDDGILDDEAYDTESLSEDLRAFLENAIQDYNDLFGTSYDTTAEKFQNYYKDLSQRLKSREVDLVIVVNMFLTGFDATTFNTLFVDKPLKAHGLLQAFSRTNRILNSVKTYGNIVCFRDLEDATNKALELFGNRDARGIVLLEPYKHYLDEYTAKVDDLLSQYPLGDPIVGEAAKKEFVKLFGAIIRLENILASFDEFASDDKLTERQKQDYRSIYLDLWDEFRRDQEGEGDKEKIDDEDVVFEIELIKRSPSMSTTSSCSLRNTARNVEMARTSSCHRLSPELSMPILTCAARRTSSKNSWQRCRSTRPSTLNGSSSSTTSGTRNSTRSSNKKTCTPRRLTNTWTMRSVTVNCRPLESRSPRS